MKKLHINENQLKIVVEKLMINEAMLDDFSLDTMKSLTSFNAKLKYCKQMLGYPIGKGSSRIVFQIDDEKVLKLAYNNKGVAQNEVEADWGAQGYGVLPTLFENDDDGEYIITEYVLPAKLKDFQQCLGITFQEFIDFITVRYNAYCRNGLQKHTNMSNERFEELCENNEWLDNFQDYQSSYGLPYGDLTMIQNYGMTIRNGEAIIVLLDSGLNDQVWNTHYKR